MPHLISADGNRIPLRPGQSYTLGRGRLSEIPLRDRACSRVHARLAVERGGALFLEDRHSRNGTWLDGDLVLKRAPVADGSRVRVGSSVFLVRLGDLQEDAYFAETGTLGFEEAEGEIDLASGELARVGLVEILTRLLVQRRDVTLRAALREGHEAKVEVRAGEVLAAECLGLEGFNALVKLGRQTTGIFWLTECADRCPRNVQERPDRLLSQLARCLAPAAARAGP